MSKYFPLSETARGSFCQDCFSDFLAIFLELFLLLITDLSISSSESEDAEEEDDEDEEKRLEERP